MVRITLTKSKRSQILSRYLGSVSGPVYTSSNVPNAPMVTLFTKEDCSLCDKVKDILASVREQHPHSLEQVDITDNQHNTIWYEKYKYDIPILHLNGKYWIKHKLTEEEAVCGLTRAREATFVAQSGEPDAGAKERRQANKMAQ